MPRKKKEETSVETSGETIETDAANETPVEADAVESQTLAAGSSGTDDVTTDEVEVAENTVEQSSIFDSVIDTVTSVAGSVASTVSDGVSSVVSAVTGSSDKTEEKSKTYSKRAEKIGVVASDKMTKTVVVRVDRVVKHQVYRKYIKRKKKFMAHDETGAAIGDKVRIVETRPLSAHKRWRVVEIIQKAEK
jgi:small subunit ribosomal protein S17